MVTMRVTATLYVPTEEKRATSDDLQALLRQHMKVIEEKRELEEAIFRMRKKLLSISNSAAAAAGNFLF
jgi:hypothetical protein